MVFFSFVKTLFNRVIEILRSTGVGVANKTRGRWRRKTRHYEGPAISGYLKKCTSVGLTSDTHYSMLAKYGRQNRTITGARLYCNRTRMAKKSFGPYGRVLHTRIGRVEFAVFREKKTRKKRDSEDVCAAKYHIYTHTRIRTLREPIPRYIYSVYTHCVVLYRGSCVDDCVVV